MDNTAFADPLRQKYQQQKYQIHPAYNPAQHHQMLYDAAAYYAYQSAHHADYGGYPSSAYHHHPYHQPHPPRPPPRADPVAATAPESPLHVRASRGPYWDHHHLAATQFQQRAPIGVVFPALSTVAPELAMAPPPHPWVGVESSHRGRGRRGRWPFRGGRGRGNFGGHSEVAPTFHGRERGRQGGGNSRPNHNLTPEAATTLATKSLSIMESMPEEPQDPTLIAQPVTTMPRCPILPHAWCYICRVECNSLEVLKQHKKGKRHNNTVKRLQEMQAQQTVMADLQARDEAKPEIQSSQDNKVPFLDKENKLSQVCTETTVSYGRITAPSILSDRICVADKAVAVSGNIDLLSARLSEANKSSPSSLPLASSETNEVYAGSILSENFSTATIEMDQQAKDEAMPEIRSSQENKVAFLDKENKLSQVCTETIVSSGHVTAPSILSDRICEADKAVAVSGNIDLLSARLSEANKSSPSSLSLASSETNEVYAGSIQSENFSTATIEMDQQAKDEAKPEIQSSQDNKVPFLDKENKLSQVCMKTIVSSGHITAPSILSDGICEADKAVAVSGNIDLLSARLSEANKGSPSSLPLASSETNEVYAGSIPSENFSTGTIEMNYKMEQNMNSQTVTAQAETNEGNAVEIPEYIEVPVAGRKSWMNSYGRGRGSKRKMTRYWRVGKQDGKRDERQHGKRLKRMNAVGGKPQEHQKERPRVCTLCNATCKTQSVFKCHLSGRKHISRIKRFQSENTVFGPISPYIPPGQSTAHPSQALKPLSFGLNSHEKFQETCTKEYELRLSGGVEQVGEAEGGNLVHLGQPEAQLRAGN